ncbi:MAG TPA: hypothetical protein VFH54_17730 [Mycobacteriales bacterium]|jgi:hypothetical protein|nr:hypothetical protein [Mycobacteriales bacterium]HET7405512.1 hypothetical protein [Mycobacteriales bacterium]
MLRLFARRKGRHAAGARVPAPAAVVLPAVVPVPRPRSVPSGPAVTDGSADAAYGVQLTFSDGTSLALPESSPYTLAMRTTASLLLSTEVRQRR